MPSLEISAQAQKEWGLLMLERSTTPAADIMPELQSAPVRIAFADDHPTLLRGVADLFGEDERFQTVGTGSTAEDAVALVRERAPDVLIVDLNMPGSVIDAIRTIRHNSPATRLVVFTGHADPTAAAQLFDAGAHAFILKGRPIEELFHAVSAVLAGDTFVSPDFAPRLVSTHRERASRSVKLSAREAQLVACLLEAKSNREIARTLNLTEKTVKHYMTNLMNKFQVRSRLEVVLAAQRLNQVSDRSYNGEA
ncbi:MAG: response regulator transcription factor [Rubrivivax sp.]